MSKKNQTPAPASEPEAEKIQISQHARYEAYLCAALTGLVANGWQEAFFKRGQREAAAAAMAETAHIIAAAMMKEGG